MDSLLHISDLKTTFATDQGILRAVDGLSLDIAKGETFALLGESGCGKSMSALSIMRLIPEPAGRISQGKIELAGEDLLQLPETIMRNVRGKRIAMIFQEPMTSLNPVFTIGFQIGESVRRHKGLKGAQAENRVLELLDAVGIPDPKRRIHEYPHQLSGGMKQRVMIAMALAGEPELLIADEPTTALDVTIQAQVLDLMRQLQKDTGMSILLITHDLGVVAEMADRVAVMYAGEVVELADRETFFANPRHPYSQMLFASLPGMNKRGQRLAMIPGQVPSLTTTFTECRFADRCQFAWDRCHSVIPQWYESAGAENSGGVRCHLYDEHAVPPAGTDKVQTSPEPDFGEAKNTGAADDFLKVEHLKVHFPVKGGLLQRKKNVVYAVDDISMQIPSGQTLALVGESGCGKTTVGRSILQLIRPTSGSVNYHGTELTTLNKRELRRYRSDIQIIFQDPFSSMNPRMMVGDIIEEGMITQRIGGNAAARSSRIDQLLRQVGLSADIKHRYPHEFSGGQRQRICIARALAVDPKLIICDEPTSALDVSVQAQILNLLKDLQQQLGLTYLFITHDLSVVEYLAHEVAVMYLGRIVEQGEVKAVMQNPLHPYTQALLSAVPKITRADDITSRPVLKVRGETPSPINPPGGCHFHPRCDRVMPECRIDYPDSRLMDGAHSTRCFLYKSQG